MDRPWHNTLHTRNITIIWMRYHTHNIIIILMRYHTRNRIFPLKFAWFRGIQFKKVINLHFLYKFEGNAW